MSWGFRRHQMGPQKWVDMEPQRNARLSFSSIRDLKENLPSEESFPGNRGSTCRSRDLTPHWKDTSTAHSTLDYHFNNSSRISLGGSQQTESWVSLLHISSMFSKHDASESHHPASLHMTSDHTISQIHFQRVKIYTKTVLLVLKAIKEFPQNVLSNYVIQISL